MLRKIVSGLVLTILFVGMLTSTFCIHLIGSNPGTITVPDDLPIIQEAINKANAGDTIYVRAGIYYENLLINKPISLVGENPSTTIIDGGEVGAVVNVSTSNILIEKLTIQNSRKEWKFFDSGIFVDYFSPSSPDVITNIVIRNNNIEKNAHGISFFGFGHLSNVVIEENKIEANENGIYICVGSGGTIAANDISNNEAGGIWLHAVSNYCISENNIEANDQFGGIWFENESSNNILFHNNFIDNNLKHPDLGWQVYPEPPSTNTWDNGYEGNYWSDYTGVDEFSGPNQDQPGSDSIGDTPYVINENNQDQYPLMNPWTTHVTCELNVPFYSQRYQGWASEKLGEGETCELTIGGYGCALTSCAMVMAYYGARINNEIANPLNLNIPEHFYGCDLRWGNEAEGPPFTYIEETCHTEQNRIDYIYRKNYNPTEEIEWDRIDTELSNGCPVIVRVSNGGDFNHYVVFYGRRESEYLFYDPWDTVRTERRWSIGSDTTTDVPKDAFFPDLYTLTGLKIYHGVCLLPTDLDRDGIVNIIDLTTVALSFGTKEGDTNYNVIADLDRNGEVNILDLSTVAMDYGKTV